MPCLNVSNGLMSLTPVQPDHIQLIRIWRNNQLNILRQSDYLSESDQISYFDNYVWPDMDSRQPNQILLSIFDDKTLIGYGGIVHIHWTDRRGEVSFLLRTDLMDYPHKVADYFATYLSLLKHIAFELLQFRKLSTETFAHRKSIISILESSDFWLEGRLRRHVLVDNIPIDSLIHGCLAEDAI